MAGETATATFTCQAPSGGQIALRVTGAPQGVTATVAPGTPAGNFVLTAKAAADASATYGYIQVAADGLGYPQTYQVAVSLRGIPKPTCYVAKQLTIPTGAEAELGAGCRSDEGRAADIKIEIVEQPKHGRLAGAEGDWIYRPNRGFIGEDHVAFQAKNQYGTTPVYRIAIRVRKATRYERDAEYHQRICADASSNTSCRQGRGRTTKGGAGTGKVTHKNWPRITGVYFSFPYSGGGRLVGGELNDQLTGHHGSDTIFGGAGSDVIWGDWDPENNNGRQRDSLNGGAGRTSSTRATAATASPAARATTSSGPSTATGRSTAGRASTRSASAAASPPTSCAAASGAASSEPRAQSS